MLPLLQGITSADTNVSYHTKCSGRGIYKTAAGASFISY